MFGDAFIFLFVCMSMLAITSKVMHRYDLSDFYLGIDPNHILDTKKSQTFKGPILNGSKNIIQK